jgi:putative lipoic acid-binding regulatory protein
MNDKPSCLQFPCTFPIKVMGHNTKAFSSAVEEIFNRHLNPGQYTSTSRLSSGNKYLSITVTFTAQSKNQLNTLYEDLNKSELVVMTL